MKKLTAAVVALIMVMAFIPSGFAMADEYGECILHYTFDEGTDCGEVHNAKIEHGYAYFDGSADSYIKMPDNIAAGENVLTFVINVRPEMGAANQFTFTLGSADTNYIFLNTNKGEVSRFGITTVGWWDESGVEAANVPEKEWRSIVIVLNEKQMTMYQNGEKAAEGESKFLASALGETNKNYLAKSQYPNDAPFKGYITDFAIYKEALSEEAIKSIAESHAAEAEIANEFAAKFDLEKEADKITFAETEITKDIELPSMAGNATVTWKSNNPNVISDEGIVTLPNEETAVTMTATVSDGTYSIERDFVFNVIAEGNIASLDAEALHLVGNLLHLKEDLYLPSEGRYKSTITWESSDESVISSDGTINQAPVGGGSKSATLTAYISYGGKVETKTFDVTVEETDYSYLFAYFTGNQAWQEKMYYGLSQDGYYFNTINGGNPVMEEKVGTGCLRDPFIFKGQDGAYYCLATDMKSSLGWSSNYRITSWRSEDLVTWTDETLFDCREIFKNENLTRAWAPQAIWDPEYYDEETGEYGAYMIYFAVKIDGMYNNQTQMWKMYTKDMKTLISEPEFFYASNGLYSSDIDSDIIYKDGLYYMYVKDETQGGLGGVHVVTSKHAGGPYSERITELPRQDTNGNTVAIEGSAIYKLIGQDKYNLVYDAYNSGFFVMSQTEDLVNFEQFPRNKYGFDFTPRHGYVVTISKAETEALEAAYGKAIADEMEAKEEPILWYSFDDDGKDISGNFSDAQLKASAKFSSGVSGSGLYLDGTGESYAVIPSEAVSNLRDYTIEAWYKPEKADVTQRIFDFGNDTNRYMFFTPFYADNTARYAITVGSFGNENGISVNKPAPLNEWSHVAVTSEGDKISLYIDGELVGEIDGVELDPYEISSKISNCYIGKSAWSGDQMFKGTIDEFKIYNRALSANEIEDEYNELLPFSYKVTEENGVVTVTIANSAADIESVDVVIAQYDEGGVMTEATREVVTFEGEERTKTVTKSVSGKYKVFVLESLESLKPIK